MPYADTLISGGRVFRGLREGFAEAIAISGQRIVACGARAAVEALAGPGTRRIDLAGRVAIPAFNDAHQHLLPMGLGLAHVNLRAEQVRTLDDLLARIRAAARAAPRGAWVLGRGYDHGELDVGRHPTAEELTAAAPDNPVFIVRTCGHVGVANKAALQLAEVGHNTPDPEGGAIERRNGALTGLFQERAMRLIKDKIPEPSDAELRNAITVAGEHMLGLGFTGVMDANVGMAGGMREIAAYRALHEEGRLPVRVWLCLAGNPEGIADAAWQAGIRPNDGDDMLRFGAIKVFGDGSAGGLTAAMSEPYLPGGTGIFCFPTETMHALLAKYHRQGWQLAIHAIGDAAIEQVLSGMEAADTADQPVGGRRHRIEHCGFLSEGQIARMTARGIEPVPQPIFMYEFGDLYVRNVGQARAEAAYPMRSWLDAGQHPAASSDAPVSTTDPFRNIFTQVTRKTNRGTVLGGDQRLSVAEAVYCYTYCGAYTQFAEDRKGRLLPGMLADITILSRDIFAGTPEEILGTEADLVLRDGQAVFDRHGQFA
jgi:predicted amidohydrolase YtcJ